MCTSPLPNLQVGQPIVGDVNLRFHFKLPGSFETHGSEVEHINVRAPLSLWLRLPLFNGLFLRDLDGIVLSLQQRGALVVGRHGS